jgi:hypothetical protein
MTFSEIDEFVFEKVIVLFLFDNFRVHRFCTKKHHEKDDFGVSIKCATFGGLWASKRIPL